jgi:hypothetical protein
MPRLAVGLCVARHHGLRDPLQPRPRLSRDHDVPAVMLGDDFSGVLIVDGLAS